MMDAGSRPLRDSSRISIWGSDASADNMDDLQGDGESGFLEKLFLNITGNGDLIDRAKRVGDYLFRSEDS